MKNDKIDPKILRSNYIPTAEFYSQIIDSLQDYSIFTLDKCNNLTVINRCQIASKLAGQA